MGSVPSFDNLPPDSLFMTSEYLGPESLTQLSRVNRNTLMKMDLIHLKVRVAALVRQQKILVKAVWVDDSS